MSKPKDPNEKIVYYMEKIRKLQNDEIRRSSRASSTTKSRDVVAEDFEGMREIHSRASINDLVTNSSASNSPPSPGELPASPGELPASPSDISPVSIKTFNEPPVTRPETLKARILRNESITVMAHSSKEEPTTCSNSYELVKILQPPTLSDENLEISKRTETVSKKATGSKNLEGDHLRNTLLVNGVGIIDSTEICSLKKIPRKIVETGNTHKSKNEAKAKDIQGSNSARKESKTSLDNTQKRSSNKESNWDEHISKKRYRARGEPFDEYSSSKKPRTTSETSDMHDSDNDKSPDITTRLELALGDDLSLGEDINSNLALKVLDPILRKGLSVDQEEKLLKAYSTPANCKLLKAPMLNEEISSNLQIASRNRDKKMEMKQDQLGLGITAISRAITLLIRHEGDSNTSINSNFKIDAIKHLNHGCRLLADLHYKETKVRKYFCSRELQNHPVFRNLKFRDLERDDTLYGSKLTRMIKRQGIPLTGERTRPFPSHGDSCYQRNGFSTNYPLPSPPRRGEPRSPPILRNKEI